MWQSISTMMDQVGRNAWTLIPLALMVGAICRWGRCRPVTRHSLWLSLLVWLGAGLFLPPIDLPTLAQSVRTSDPRPSPTQYRTVGTGRHDVKKTLTVQRHFRSTEPRIHLPTLNHNQPMSVPPAIHPELRPHRSPSPTPPRAVVRTKPRTPSLLLPAPGLVGQLSALDSSIPPSRRPSVSRAWADAPHPHSLDVDLGRLPDQTSLQRSSLSNPEPGTVPILFHREFEKPLPSHDGEVAVFPSERGPLPHGRGSEPGYDQIATIQAPSEKPSSIQTPVPTPPALFNQIQRWTAALVSIRDALGRLPPIPPVVWIAGIVLIALFKLHQVLRFRSRLGAGVPVPDSVNRLVAETASLIGLRRLPEIVMVPDRVSPMIWCGRRARLILPRGLWSELDEDGRRAILFHELAHLRRRDHWICWIDSLIGALYWWHPAVWWVRDRIRSEAENACDAWVTWLLPNGRRAYAEALVTTRAFVSKPIPNMPSTGIGAITGRTHRFARRLTMVMTQQSAPNISIPGIALAISMVFVAWLATPAQSCEPGEPAAPETIEIPVIVEPVEPAPPAAPILIETPNGEVIHVAPGVVTVPSGVATFAPRVSAGVPGMVWAVADDHEAPPPGHEPTGLEARIQRLERQLAKLSEQLERMTAQPKANTAYRMLRKQQQSEVQSHQEAVRAYQDAAEVYSGGGGRGTAPSFSVADRGASRGVIVRTYKLPKGKLEALSKLMVRSDVPTRVRRLEDGIELHGTLADHIRFKAFVDIITKKGEQNVGYHLPKGKLQALVELMSRDDVPVFIEPATNDKAICVHGDPAVQAIFKAFVDMIHPSNKNPDRISSRGNNGNIRKWFDRDSAVAFKEKLAQGDTNAARESAEQALRERLMDRESNSVSSSELRSRLMAELFAQRTTLREYQAQSNSLESQAERLEETADRLEDQADDLRDRAEDLREKASETENSKRASKLREEAQTLVMRALELEQASLESRNESKDIERDMNHVNGVVEELEVLLEELEEKAEASAR